MELINSITDTVRLILGFIFSIMFFVAWYKGDKQDAMIYGILSIMLETGGTN